MKQTNRQKIKSFITDLSISLDYIMYILPNLSSQFNEYCKSKHPLLRGNIVLDIDINCLTIIITDDSNSDDLHTDDITQDEYYYNIYEDKWVRCDGESSAIENSSRILNGFLNKIYNEQGETK